MITYICKNRERETGKKLPCTDSVCSTSTCSVCGGRTEAESVIFWCENCNIPLYESICGCCGNQGKKLCSDLRPVFPKERLLLEILLDKPFAYKDASVWNGSGNHYYVNGKRIPFTIKDLKKKDPIKVRQLYLSQIEKNTEDTFWEIIKKFLVANRERYEKIFEEATSYIRECAKDVSETDMFVSFSGGKDSTVTADLVTRALGNPKIMHIFGDTTLEFPYTYEYVQR